MIQIGPHKIDAFSMLAPMSGVTDLPFRQQARKFGAKLVVSEMVASEELATGGKQAWDKAAMDDGSGLKILQLVGREAKWMFEAARIAEGEGADIIDINMGCPAKKVTNGLSGSALMRDLDHAQSLIEATLAAVTVPVTLKMRLGWDNETINAPELAARAEACGVKLMTVHGRTRQQFYKGEANWSAIRDVVNAVSIPVVVNGDIKDSSSARAAINSSGAAVAMIGRASEGQPWLVGQIDAELRNEPTNLCFARKVEGIASQLECSLKFYGDLVGLRTMRKHLAAFANSETPNPQDWRKRLCRTDEPVDVFEELKALARLELEAA